MIREGIINFKYFNFDIESYYFFRRFEFVVSKKIRQQTCCSYIYLAVHRFLARVQSPTCTTYGEFLLKSIMAMLTPKSGVLLFQKFLLLKFAFFATLDNKNFKRSLSCDMILEKQLANCRDIKATVIL